MAKRYINAAVGEIAGKIGDLVLYRRKGKPCIRGIPVRVKPFTVAERNHQTRFKLAAEFAKSVLSDPDQRLRYERAAEDGEASAQNLAIRDFFRPPVLTDVNVSQYTGQTGQTIRICVAEGKLGAASVQVRIADRQKSTLEAGPAVMDPDGVTWRYTAKRDLALDQMLWITVTASDQPGNRVTKTFRHVTG